MRFAKNVLDELARTFIFARLVQILSVANEEFAIQFIDDAYEKLNNFAPNWNKNPYYWFAKVKLAEQTQTGFMSCAAKLPSINFTIVSIKSVCGKTP